MPNKEKIKLSIRKNYNEQADLTFDSLVSKLCNLESLEYVNQKITDSLSSKLVILMDTLL